jgi:DNA-binding MarR family transcriptional regulator
MELPARPLLASALDARLFVDRKVELETLERNAESRLNSLVVGPPGIGKTSLLHQLERRLDSHEELEPIFVDGAGRAASPEELLSLINYRLDEDRARFSYIGEAMQTAGRRPPRTGTEQLLAALRTVREALAARERRTVLIVDELPSGETAHALFGQLRDELWSLPATWVVAARTSEQAAYLRPPASAFFESVVTVEPLPEKAAMQLLKKRTADAEIDGGLLREIAGAADGQPALLILLARQTLLEGRSLNDAQGAQDERMQRAKQLGDAASRLVAYIEANGPVSASDARMLSELSWTRGRATQVLRQLEQAGLAEVSNERVGSGRRKVYTLKTELRGAA